MRTGSAAAVLTVLLSSTVPALAAPAGPLDEARRAAEQTVFEGVLDVSWVDGDVTRSEKLTVKAGHSTVAVIGGNRVMAVEPFARMVSHGGKPWEELWAPTTTPSVRPDGAAKYQVTTVPDGPQVAGRPTFTVEVRHAGALRERLHLDTATSLPLEREQYDDRGAISRTLAFETLTVGSADVPVAPSVAAHHAPRLVSASQPAPSVMPDTLPEGYERLGVYRSGDVAQALYSDGIYDLSVFQQPGRLRRADLPSAGERVAVGTTTGVRYAWAGGNLLVWSTGGTIFTAVGDGPPEEMLGAVRALPMSDGRAPSLLGKLRRACRAVMEPLS